MTDFVIDLIPILFRSQIQLKYDNSFIMNIKGTTNCVCESYK